MNDPAKWERFTRALIKKTESGELEWRNFAGLTSRDQATGQIFVAEILPAKFVAVYRFDFRRWFDVDEYETSPEVAIELADERGRMTWRLPEVPSRWSLIDAIEFQYADAERTFKDFVEESDG